MTRRHTTLAPTPIGPLTLVADGDDLVAVYMDGHAHHPGSTALGQAGSDPVLARAAAQLSEYFAGERQEFDLPLRPIGTDFQVRVWRALQQIPYGVTWSYRELATAVGNPSASRAVGLANGRNPLSIVIPCHRVIGADGSLTGYGGGVERKRWLLDLERQESLLPGLS
ncbi:methylated-DNA--[protein]-cysteine S-methyltransferase [Branchiibius cervicis]|uniref:Methylated-DNA--protein-cysteine methyltransferase n=1 Tax=Branchiibius cervicis TaxID=908252 RepID=A0ABW2API4_9MICO